MPSVGLLRSPGQGDIEGDVSVTARIGLASLILNTIKTTFCHSQFQSALITSHLDGHLFFAHKSD
jgi:hypothetical protein